MQAIKIFTPLLLSVALFGCNQAKDTATDTANKAVDTATTAVNTTASAVSNSTQVVGSAVSETASAVVNTTTSVANAVNPNMTPAEHQDAREDIMKQYGRTSKALRGMTEDPAKFNADELKKHVETLKQDPWGHFPDTAQGGDAKEEVWTNPAEFQAQVDKYKTAVSALETAAANATSIDAVKAQIGDVGASCKSCHEKFKEDN
nr:cytochrome c [uncultured Moraxella sp.]